MYYILLIGNLPVYILFPPADISGLQYKKHGQDPSPGIFPGGEIIRISGVKIQNVNLSAK